MADRSGSGQGRASKRKAEGEVEEQVEVEVVVHLHDGAPDGDRCGRHRYIDGARFVCAGKIVAGKLFRGVDPRDKKSFDWGRCEGCCRGGACRETDFVSQRDLLGYRFRSDGRPDLVGSASDAVLDDIEGANDSEHWDLYVQRKCRSAGQGQVAHTSVRSR